MSLYREKLLPRLVDRACGSEGMERWRRRVTDGLSGTVVEIGFGSGLNMAAYPPEVTKVFRGRTCRSGSKAGRAANRALACRGGPRRIAR
ncbi:MAG: hypothetical protein M5U19_00510 [Microthrixaceae bacterium]|nr:hypothetical protein [Microthrixaceae bacterium]